MTLSSTAHELLSLGSSGPVQLLASGAEGEHGAHESLNPLLVGGGALFALLLLLWITTRFNRDR